MPADIHYNLPKKKKENEPAAVYARYSSHTQGEQSIEGQLAEARKYAASHGYNIVHEYIDRAKSGRTDNREAFQQMLKDTAKKQFSVVIIWKIDRFGRNREEIAINKMKCRKNGVRVEYVAEKIPDTPEGVILESVLEGFAEYYSLQLSQNIRRGLAESAEKCQYTGGVLPFGYKATADRRYVLDEETAPIAKMIFAMYAKGHTVSKITGRLNEMGLRTTRGTPFTKNSLRTMLSNEKYRGVYNSHGRHIEDGVPRIVDDELFYEVQKMLEFNKRAPARNKAKTEYILFGKLFCGKCGAHMFGECGTSRTGERYNYYICANHKRFHTCNKKAVRQADIESLVIQSVIELLQNDELREFIIEGTWQYYLAQDHGKEEIACLQQQLEQTESAIQNLIRAIEAGILTVETKVRMDELTTQKLELQASIADRELDFGYHLERSHIAYYMEQLRDADHTDPEVQKQLIKTFVNAVFVYDDHIKLTFNYSGGNNSTVSLKMLEAAESGETFVYKASCSTKATQWVVFFMSRGDENGFGSE